MKAYMAQASNDGWVVAEAVADGASCRETHPIGDIRTFTTFDEADEVAYQLAQGAYDSIRPAGVYVCNR